MKISEAEYFAYAIPAVLAFIIGLHSKAGDLEGEFIDQKAIARYVDLHPKLPYFFIIIGFVSSVISSFFGSELAFVFYLLGSFKFIGLFLLVLGSNQIKLLPLIVVLSSIVGSSFGEGMFHDLLTWILFIGSVFAYKYRLGFSVKLIGTICFIFLAVAIQVLKSSYRTAIGSDIEEGGVETFSRLYEQQNSKRGIFTFESLAPHVVRINQGFIITNIMKNVPATIPYSNGQEMYQILEAAIMPRILAPNKLNAGDRTLFMKYSGIRIKEGTSMGLSSLGDAYLNFGLIGGSIFMLLLGLLYNYILRQFYKNSKVYPILILFTSMVFYYPIRPDCELQTILGHLFKSIVLIYLILLFFKKSFKVDPV
jgi:hypothetical protein